MGVCGGKHICRRVLWGGGDEATGRLGESEMCDGGACLPRIPFRRLHHVLSPLRDLEPLLRAGSTSAACLGRGGDIAVVAPTIEAVTSAEAVRRGGEARTELCVEAGRGRGGKEGAKIRGGWEKEGGSEREDVSLMGLVERRALPPLYHWRPAAAIDASEPPSRHNEKRMTPPPHW